MSKYPKISILKHTNIEEYQLGVQTSDKECQLIRLDSNLTSTQKVLLDWVWQNQRSEKNWRLSNFCFWRKQNR